MRNTIKGLFVGLAAMIAMAFGANTASAITISPGGAITATSLGAVDFASDILTLSCDITLTGSLATSGSAGSRIGAITSGSMGNCGDGWTVTLLFGSEWPLRLVSTAGSPITSALLNIERIGIGLNFLGSPWCLYGGTAGARYTEGGLIALLANSLTGDCGTASFSAGTQFGLSPAQDFA